MKFEKIINGLIIGGTFPFFFGLLSVVIWFTLDRSENRPLIFLTAGLLTGLIIDSIFLKGWIDHRFDLPVWFLAAIYVIYNVLFYGFFMGFPVFNTFLGLFAGYYSGKRVCFKNIEPEIHSKLINQVSFFSGMIMTLVCILSGFLALVHNEAAGMLKEVLRLRFEVTKPMVWAIVLTGSLALIVTNILLTRFAMIKTIKNNTH